MTKPQNKSFLSHQSSDKLIVEEIGKKLLSSGIEVFYDEWDILGGDSIPQEIEESISDSNILIYALSPASVESKWVKAEYHSFLYRKINDHSLRIIPVLLADCEKPAFIAPLKHIDFRSFDLKRPDTHSTPIEELLRTIFRSTTKPPLGNPHPALASFEFYFQDMKNPSTAEKDNYWEIGFKNITDTPLHNFAFAVEFSNPVETIEYDFNRSSANMDGGAGLSKDRNLFHWFGNQIMEDGGWVVFTIKSKGMPKITRLCTKLLGRSHDASTLFSPDPSGVQEIAELIEKRNRVGEKEKGSA